jgi:hypothetical protein
MPTPNHPQPSALAKANPALPELSAQGSAGRRPSPIMPRVSPLPENRPVVPAFHNRVKDDELMGYID